MALVLNDLSPQGLWQRFSRFVDAKEDGTFEQLASMDNSANGESLGGDLHAPALRFMESLVEMLLVLGRHHWGEPDHLFQRKARDQMWPAKDAPPWLEDFLYPQGISTKLYRVIGWNRQRKRGESVIGFAYIDLYSDDGDEAGSWQITITIGVLSGSK
jgi:hypothetical protein